MNIIIKVCSTNLPFEPQTTAATAGDAKCLFQQRCLSIKITETVPSFLIITICDRQGRGTFSL